MLLRKTVNKTKLSSEGTNKKKFANPRSLASNHDNPKYTSTGYATIKRVFPVAYLREGMSIFLGLNRNPRFAHLQSA